MPNRYEREIEEILRNLETTEPKQGLGQKFGQRLRRKPEYRVKSRRRGFPSLKISGFVHRNALFALPGGIVDVGHALP